MEEGAFEHLEGTGQPISLDDDVFEDPSEKMAHKILKNNGLAPTWIAESRAIDEDLAKLHREVSGSARSPCQMAARLANLNSRIEKFNLTVPIAGRHKRLIRLRDMLEPER